MESGKMGARTVTLAFGPHRAEVLPLIRKIAAAHRALVLEEPPHPDFHRMLRRAAGLRCYLRDGDFNFPRFTLRACRLYQELHDAGVHLYQVEPYLAAARRQAAGAEPATDLERRVWQYEHAATGALLNYYAAVPAGDFAAVVQAVKEFARADASRLRFRAKLRAEAVAELLRQTEGDVCVEAGYIHLILYPYLRGLAPPRTRVRSHFLLREPLRALFGLPWRQHLGPGDVLTLRYTFGASPSPRDDLLAARSLVYVSLLPKEELLPCATDPYPHLSREISLLRFAGKLSLEECARYYHSLVQGSARREDKAGSFQAGLA